MAKFIDVELNLNYSDDSNNSDVSSNSEWTR